MKKYKIIVFALIGSIGFGSIRNVEAKNQNADLFEVIEKDQTLIDGILTISDSEFVSKHNILKERSKSKLQKCLKKGNVIALYHKQKKDCSMAEVLEFPIDVSDKSCLGENESYCTLYYLDENGVPTIHDIDIEQEKKAKKKNADDIVQGVERDVLKKNRNR
ncbi:hypothetical protein [[Clostridium] polysaccharolyticum]|uniref:Uncharacterized protein n=1 Tax=[Clostridium] polysaccharolyticum TaxID=29364 RepID=A0A1I0BWZ8_9FIRM|nr:hypothetical protein [[Clostridium] polysaccharolyticum]SET10912.1 hypothetical protein SAMN04487772_108108 [[Clostridium] polysaccharolyticum]